MIHATQGRPSTGMSLTSCSPPDENGAVRSLTAPAVPGPGVCIPQRLSNLDQNGKLVKRGLTVSYHGFRYVVLRVRLGRLVGRCSARSQSGKLYERDEWLKCESVQVVV